MVRFVEVVNKTDKNPMMERTAKLSFELTEVWINEKYVINIRAHTGYRRLLEEGSLPSELDNRHQFTAVTVSEGNQSQTHIVVGEAATGGWKVDTRSRSVAKGLMNERDFQNRKALGPRRNMGGHTLL